MSWLSAVIVIGWLTITVVVCGLLVQLFASVTVTVYDVVSFGETNLFEIPTVPSFHVYVYGVVPPVAFTDIEASFPWHIPWLGVIVYKNLGGSTTEAVALAVHSFWSETVTEYVPGIRLVTVGLCMVVDQLYVKGAVPPVTFAVIVPSFLPKQVTSVLLMVTFTDGAGNIWKDCDSEQLL
jgi:hypothetical protein